MINVTGLLISALIMSIPLILTALGGVFSVRAGIMALGLESMLLMGAFGSVLGSYLFQSVWMGILFGIVFGMLIGGAHGLLCIRYKVNQVISGIGLNLLVQTMTTIFMQMVWGNKGNSAVVPRITLKLSFLKGIPFIGDILSAQSVMFAIMIGLVIVGYFLLFKTPFGLRLRMCGENPKAASTLGIRVHFTKYMGVLICGALCGLAGTYLAIDNLNLFVRDMSAGRGYIALAIAILSRYNPKGVLIFGLLFGICDALQIYTQGYGIPSQLVQMIPYVVTLFVLALGVKNIQPPAGVGKNEDE